MAQKCASQTRFCHQSKMKAKQITQSEMSNVKWSYFNFVWSSSLVSCFSDVLITFSQFAKTTVSGCWKGGVAGQAWIFKISPQHFFLDKPHGSLISLSCLLHYFEDFQEMKIKWCFLAALTTWPIGVRHPWWWRNFTHSCWCFRTLSSLGKTEAVLESLCLVVARTCGRTECVSLPLPVWSTAILAQPKHSFWGTMKNLKAHQLWQVQHCDHMPFENLTFDGLVVSICGSDVEQWSWCCMEFHKKVQIALLGTNKI